MEIFSMSFGEKDTEKILKIIGILFQYFFNISVPSIVQCIQCQCALESPWCTEWDHDDNPTWSTHYGLGALRVSRLQNALLTWLAVSEKGQKSSTYYVPASFCGGT